MSPYALLTGAVLVLLAAPLIWMAGRVAHDHLFAGALFVAGLVGLVVALYAHHGTRLVDITLGVVGVAAAAIVVATIVGVAARRRREPAQVVTSELPAARLHRSR